MVVVLLFTRGKYMISVQQLIHSTNHNVLKDDEGMYKCIADSVHSFAKVEIIHFTDIITTDSSV